MTENEDLIEIRCEKHNNLLCRVDNKAFEGVLEIKCKRCKVVHIFKEGKEVQE